MSVARYRASDIPQSINFQKTVIGLIPTINMLHSFVHTERIPYLSDLRLSLTNQKLVMGERVKPSAYKADELLLLLL